MEKDLPPEVCEFIARHIVSIEQLEVLLMLHDDPAHAWTPAEINDRLRSQEPSISKWLDSLVQLQLAAVAEGRFRFAPASDQLARQCAAIAAAYRERRIKVIEYVFAKPHEDLLHFVRAFDLRKRP